MIQEWCKCLQLHMWGVGILCKSECYTAFNSGNYVTLFCTVSVIVFVGLSSIFFNQDAYFVHEHRTSVRRVCTVGWSQ